MKDEELAKHLHDFRNSISVISGFLRCIQNYKLSQSHRELYQATKTSLEKMKKNLELINEITKPKDPL